MADPETTIADAAGFKTTHWSVVLSCKDGSDSVARPALEQLCQAYWFPLYAYVRRQGLTPEDAKDLTQSFFERFLSRGSFALADPERGRFRAFLLTSLKRFLSEEWRRMNRQKRGGGQACVQIDTEEAEGRYAADALHELSPDRLYDRRWAEALLGRVMARLAEDYEASGRSALCRKLQQFVWGGQPEVSYAEVSAQLGMSEGAVKVAVHRLRRRFRDLLQAEVTQTVQTPEQVQEELQHLLNAFAT